MYFPSDDLLYMYGVGVWSHCALKSGLKYDLKMIKNLMNKYNLIYFVKKEIWA